MKILYLGESGIGTTSYHRAQAILRLGHNLNFVDPYIFMIKEVGSYYIELIHHKTGYRFIQKTMLQFCRTLKYDGVDIIWVNMGELFGIKVLQQLRKSGAKLVLYNNDDPTGGRDKRRFDMLLKALPFYDLCVVMREFNVDEFKKRGARNVLRVTMSYDEVAHKPFDSYYDIPELFKSDVCFVGTWMKNEGRDVFLKALIDAGLNIKIWGNRWYKSKYFKSLKAHYMGGSLSGRDYVAALQGAKLCIGMLSKGNRDQHTQRSLEIPFIGSLFCAERTTEHELMYRDGFEAVFWNDVNECIDICKDLLANSEKCTKIREAGHKRVIELKVGNEDICKQVLNKLYVS